jgi:hypothetical protein
MKQTSSQGTGKTQFRKAMNSIGSLIFERGLRGDLDMSVACRRLGDTTMITVIHTDGVMNFTVTDSEKERELTPRQLMARRALTAGAMSVRGRSLPRT